MAIAKFQLEDGRVVRLEVPEGTTEAEVMQFIEQNRASFDQPVATQPSRPMEDIRRELAVVQPQGNIERINQLNEEIKSHPEFREPDIRSLLEPAATVASSVVAEPIAGIAGIAQAVNPLADPGAGARAVEATREALTFQPRSEAGRAGLSALGETLAPVGKAFESAEDFLGTGVLEITGSPALAAAAATIPTAALEAVGGAAAFKRAAKIKARPGVLAATEKQAKKALVEAAPDIDVIKDTSRAIYKEIDDIGVTLKPKAFEEFISRVVQKAKKERVNKNLTPKAFGAVEEISKELTETAGKSITDLDDLRRIAQDAASSIDPADARIGMVMLDEIDGFLDSVGKDAFVGANAADAANIGKKYRAARKLWGRARRSELIEEALGKAEIQASGFENGIRTQLRQIVNNKKRSRFFSEQELGAMRDVIKGTNEQNIFKLVGRLGFSEGQATNVLGSIAGGAVISPAAPIVGQFARKLAQKATAKELRVTEAIVKAGDNALEIAKAYIQSTPKAKRSSQALSDLFLNRGADVDDLLTSSNKAIKEAAELAKGRRAFISGAAAAGSLSPQIEEK